MKSTSFLTLILAVICYSSLNAQTIINLPDGQTVSVTMYRSEAGAPIADEYARMCRGVIVDENGNPISGINVSCCHDCLYPQIYGSVSDSNGKFRVKVVSGNYFIEFTALGYEKLRLSADLIQDLDMGTVVMKRSESSVLDPAAQSIKYMRKYYLMSIKTKSAYNGKTLVDLLNDAPFVDIWNEPQSVMLNPKYEIKIDGQPVRVAQETMKKYLSSISADEIRAIKVLTASIFQIETTIVNIIKR